MRSLATLFLSQALRNTRGRRRAGVHYIICIYGGRAKETEGDYSLVSEIGPLSGKGDERKIKSRSEREREKAVTGAAAAGIAFLLAPQKITRLGRRVSIHVYTRCIPCQIGQLKIQIVKIVKIQIQLSANASETPCHFCMRGSLYIMKILMNPMNP